MEKKGTVVLLGGGNEHFEGLKEKGRGNHHLPTAIFLAVGPAAGTPTTRLQVFRVGSVPLLKSFLEEKWGGVEEDTVAIHSRSGFGDSRQFTRFLPPNFPHERVDWLLFPHLNKTF